MQQFVHSFACMGTVVSMQVLLPQTNDETIRVCEDHVRRGSQWFFEIEAACNRFDPSSELRRLSETVGAPVPVSEVLFECVQFALAVADATDGIFDPTVGARMSARGLNRDYRTGNVVTETTADHTASFRAVELQESNRTITLHKALQLDLGAVAKGLAIDMAARELASLENFLINAGGDLYAGGKNANGSDWAIGIKHPREKGVYIDTVLASNSAVCTSGDYERSASDGSGHIIDARADQPVSELASVSVLAPSAMVADALGTAAFALGRTSGLAFLRQHGVKGVLVTSDLELVHTC